MSATYLNSYDGFSDTFGYTQSCLKALRPLLPAPSISPTCKRKGHEWTDERVVMFPGASMRACRRCARRGLVVIETRQDRASASNQDDAPASVLESPGSNPGRPRREDGRAAGSGTGVGFPHPGASFQDDAPAKERP